MPKEEPTSMTDIAELATQAWEAYDEKRLRDCLALTKALQTADPENTEADALLSAIRADLQRDLNDARALIDDAKFKDEPDKYRKAAEIILLKTLHLDPDNPEAKVLLQASRAFTKASAPRENPLPPPPPTPRQEEEIPFTVPPAQTEKKSERKTLNITPFALTGAVIVAAVLVLSMSSPSLSNRRPDATRESVPAIETVSSPRKIVPPSPSTNVAYSAPVTPEPIVISAPPVPSVPAVIPAPAVAAAPAVTMASAVAAPGAASVATAKVRVPAPPVRVDAAAVAEHGSLAVSSPTTADIYFGDKFMGSAPTTLELPAGSQTIEYRHGDLRTVRVHDVKPNETTAALITFDVTVQINARPWAQVFIEGAPRQALGQTPLSDARVPIGRVLVFENPNFPPKTYRVTGKNTAIQVVFP